jgi:endo-1,4-beta-xylanase
MRRFLWPVAVSILIGSFPLTAKTTWNNPPRRAEPYIQHGTFRSSALKTEVGYNVCLPPEYNAQSKRFPVIYYLHGYEGNESSYLEYAIYWRDACKRFGPSILVFVNGGEASFFCDSPDGSVPAEKLIVKELVPHIDEKYRTIATREGRSLHGYSMGGFGALKLAFEFPDMFGSVVAYGATLCDAGSFKKHLPKVYAQMFGGDAQRFAENDPFTLVERNAATIREHVAVMLFVGSKDEFLERNRALRQKLQQLKIETAHEEIRGAGHNKDDLYQPAALRAFEFSARSLAKASSHPPTRIKP